MDGGNGKAVPGGDGSHGGGRRRDATAAPVTLHHRQSWSRSQDRRLMVWLGGLLAREALEPLPLLVGVGNRQPPGRS
jgi:hypothetical protein